MGRSNRRCRWITLGLVVVLIAGASAQRAWAQPCTPESAAAVRSEWKENPTNLVLANDVVPRNLQPAIIDRIQSEIAPLFRQAYPEPQGTAAEGYAWIRSQGGELEGSPAIPFGYTTLYKTWLCPKSTGRLELAGETGNWAYVYVNILHTLVREVGEMTLDGQPTKVWMLARRIGELRGETLYQAWEGFGDAQALLFTRAGEVPWKPISQKQYLDALTLHLQEGASEANARVDELERSLEAQLEEVKRTMTGEMRDQVVAGMEQAIADLKAQRGASDPKMAAGVAAQVQVLQDYEAKHSNQEMQEPAILPESLKMAFGGEFVLESDGGNMLVTIDPRYFRSDLPRETAQLVLLLWRWQHEDPASNRWRTTFERDFPFERLRAMVDH